MNIDKHIRESIISELNRQADNSPALTVELQDSKLVINGPVDLEELVMVVTSSLAGGP
jgi:hypothetical protein